MNSGNLVIDRDTTIKALLDANQDEVINALVKLNRNFGKLQNPVLRKLLAKRVSIADACRIANCNISDFLRTMHSIGFKLKESEDEINQEQKFTFKRPPENLVIEFDVRPILAGNKDPLKEILNKVQQLKDGEYLKIINTFEPIPLIKLLQKKGYQAFTEHLNQNLVITYFFKMVEIETPTRSFLNTLASFEQTLLKFQENLKVIDVTMMDMPLPMHTILDELTCLGNEQALFVHHKKVPVYLLPHLHDKGYEYLIREEETGKVSILIYKL